jgi:hypothetical protein
LFLDSIVNPLARRIEEFDGDKLIDITR